ncbi:unnamed protein product [Clonostachys byssicola]|uniref:DUF6570 domain-containing protein n=1 Tax=Clonostachys byssicola TaxID=160290 RepID=A0A9N9U9F6_9HYPO|nr:unnamed protein product [Clonostachys byssicola]
MHLVLRSHRRRTSLRSLFPPVYGVSILALSLFNPVRSMRQLQHQFRVRRHHVRIWLQYLKANHPGCADITSSENRLGQLPVDGDASTEVPNEIDDPVDIETEVADAELPDGDDFDNFSVPNLLAGHTELEELHDMIRLQRSSASQPRAIRSTSIHEFSLSQPLLLLTFPTLYPRGQADFVEPRVRSIKYDYYLQFAMKWYDSRFVRHPRFRYVAFNTLMRHHINSRSGFYIQRPG